MLTSQDENKESGRKYVNIYHHLAYSLLQVLSKLLVPTGRGMYSKIFMDEGCEKKKINHYSKSIYLGQHKLL